MHREAPPAKPALVVRQRTAAATSCGWVAPCASQRVARAQPYGRTAPPRSQSAPRRPAATNAAGPPRTRPANLAPARRPDTWLSPCSAATTGNQKAARPRTTHDHLPGQQQQQHAESRLDVRPQLAVVADQPGVCRHEERGRKPTPEPPIRRPSAYVSATAITPSAASPQTAASMCPPASRSGSAIR